MTALLLRGDARRIPLGDETVDLIVTSPSYYRQRSYRDGGEHVAGQLGDEPHPQQYLEALWAITAECWRVLKPRGSMWINLGDKRSGSGAPGTTSGLSGRRKTGTPIPGQAQGARSQIAGSYGKAAFGRAKSKMLLPHRYAIGCEDGLADPDGLGWIIRQDQVWSKPNGMPESVTDRTRDSHEYWFHLAKQGDYFAGIDAIREPHAAVSLQRAQPHRAPAGASVRKDSATGDPTGQPLHTFNPTQACNPLGKVPGAVWTVATQPLTVPDDIGLRHFAAFPMEWPRRIISGWCPPDGLVFDPFGGTGTTALVADALGRTGITMDLSGDYLRLAAWRTTDPKQMARARGDKPPPAPRPDNDLPTLFDEATA